MKLFFFNAKISTQISFTTCLLSHRITDFWRTAFSRQGFRRILAIFEKFPGFNSAVRMFGILFYTQTLSETFPEVCPESVLPAFYLIVISYCWLRF